MYISILLAFEIKILLHAVAIFNHQEPPSPLVTNHFCSCHYQTLILYQQAFSINEHILIYFTQFAVVLVK